MKHYTLFLFLCCALVFGSTAAMAQDSRTHERRENVEAAKTAFLTDKMGLSAEQSQKFWPLYNEYEAKRRTLIKGYRSGYRQDVEELSDQEAKTRIDNMFVTKEKELELEKEYADKYLKIISYKQLIKLYRGERDFTKMLLKRLDKRASN
ncbi:Spy/CpxP family protein refolding chaperone [Pontibacter anaerobius]|uniref:Sensor of ECF-type sigma factor n=1 Tax=Pontibacter anaerobius TaxID=2993940 RepID=A0ABT3REB5_9BACT|nr:hypothetical protein [Pontibacter anaerobius]MCX2739861.1 hypothetical protein [Pontibacter anaerobius]